MVKLTSEMIEMIKATRVMPLATASADGEPNVVPIGVLYVIDPETLWIGNQFMKATEKNLKENPRACIYLWSPETKSCLKIKGDVTLLDSGADYEDMKKRVMESKKLVCNQLIVMKVTGVFDCKSGPKAGDQLL
jgi:hypothetical protein